MGSGNGGRDAWEWMGDKGRERVISKYLKERLVDGKKWKKRGKGKL